jgi:P-type E1-E2 ATPase
MIAFSVPGRGDYALEHLALDVNGTLCLDGRLIDGVAERLRALRERLQVHILSADTFGSVAEIEKVLGVSAVRIRGSADKAAFVQRLGPASVVAIGNGANDAGMLSAAALGLAVLGPEGLAREALAAADVVVPDVLAALDLLLNPQRLVATLRL